MSEVQVVNRRKANSRKIWYEISAKWINGKTVKVAKFAHLGDAELYMAHLKQGNTVDTIYVD